MNGQETEIKFYVGDVEKVEARLTKLGAQLIQPRVHETNLRFDTAQRSLRSEGKVLRLRMDTSPKMTFKGPGQLTDGVISRKEIEFEIANFDAGKELIESLGYEIMFFYEKYRRTYEIHNLHVMLDELPYGDFVEIEGEDPEEIRELADNLKLDLSRAIETSYHVLFERVVEKKNLNPKALSFEAFKGWKPSEEDLSVLKADSEE
jgi:adenylate cyclase class 2